DQPLRELAGRCVAREHPVAEVPDPLEAIEDDSRGVLADRCNHTPHRGETVRDDDLDAGILESQLCGERLRRPVVSLAHTRGAEENAHHRGGYRTAVV